MVQSTIPKVFSCQVEKVQQNMFHCEGSSTTTCSTFFGAIMEFSFVLSTTEAA